MKLLYVGFLFSIAVTRSKDVPPFGPHIPENAMFTRSDQFAEFLLAKGLLKYEFSNLDTRYLSNLTVYSYHFCTCPISSENLKCSLNQHDAHFCL